MGSYSRKGVETALSMLRALPRVSLGNIKNNPGALKKNTVRKRAQHGGDKHGAGNKGSGQRLNYMRLGYETGNNPFYLRFPKEPYYRGHHLKRQYIPVSLQKLQLMIDTNRIDISNPIDLASICNTGLFTIHPDQREYGIHLTDEGADNFKAKINIEVQWASEPVISAIERNGGVITTAYFDLDSLWILRNPEKFFERGEAIPKRMLPPEDAALYYAGASHRGYLADPEKISWERFVLAQKYGYSLPKLEDDPMYDMLSQKKDPRQIFYGLEPGWLVSLTDKNILKPKDQELLQYYST